MTLADILEVMELKNPPWDNPHNWLYQPGRQPNLMAPSRRCKNGRVPVGSGDSAGYRAGASASSASWTTARPTTRSSSGPSGARVRVRRFSGEDVPASTAALVRVAATPRPSGRLVERRRPGVDRGPPPPPASRRRLNAAPLTRRGDAAGRPLATFPRRRLVRPHQDDLGRPGRFARWHARDFAPAPRRRRNRF